jgi:alpha-L-rhamnosidase
VNAPGRFETVQSIVIDWVYRTVAGIAPDPAAPGHRHVVLAPRPTSGIDAVSASVRTGFGTVAVDWSTDAAGTFTARYQVPFGVTATFSPPADEGSVFTVDGVELTGPATLGPGKHEVRVPGARVVRPEVASLS